MDNLDRRFEARMKKIPEISTLRLEKYQIYQPKHRQDIASIITNRVPILEKKDAYSFNGFLFC